MAFLERADIRIEDIILIFCDSRNFTGGFSSIIYCNISPMRTSTKKTQRITMRLQDYYSLSYVLKLTIPANLLQTKSASEWNGGAKGLPYNKRIAKQINKVWKTQDAYSEPMINMKI